MCAAGLAASGYCGVRELAIFHEVAVTTTALYYACGGSAADAGTILVWDGAPSVILLIAHLSCRGWRCWRQPYRQDAVIPFPVTEPATATRLAGQTAPRRPAGGR